MSTAVSTPGARLPPTHLSAASSSPTDFSFPREYHYPPFFTRQPILTTLHAQLQKWSTLILSYSRSKRVFKLSLIDALATPLFSNSKINKKLDLGFAREIVDFMRAQGRADWVTASGSLSASAKVADSEKNVFWVYWRNIEEWGTAIADWVEETGQKNTVLTLYELTESDAVRSREWFGMDEELLRRSLGWLVKRGRAQVFGGTGGDEALGVKFF